jgi:glycerol-3-phosphate dehydrogenase
VLAKLAKRFTMSPGWTGDVPLPGGDLGEESIDGLIAEITSRHPYIDAAHARRLAFSYGTRVWKIIADTKSLNDLGPRIVSNLYRAELDYLCNEEWARSADDVLWRRSKLGLVATPAEVDALREALGDTSPVQMAAG